MKNAKDFDRATDGGCDLLCAVKLKFGRMWPHKGHSGDGHTGVLCAVQHNFQCPHGHILDYFCGNGLKPCRLCAVYESTLCQAERRNGKKYATINHACEAEIAPMIQENPKSGMISSGDQFDQAVRDSSIILSFLICLFDVVNHRKTCSCATSHTSRTIFVSYLPPAPTCFPSTFDAGLLSSTAAHLRVWPPSNNPPSITCSATPDWRQLHCPWRITTC